MLFKIVVSKQVKLRSVNAKLLCVTNVGIGIMAFVIYLTRVDVLYNEYTMGSCFFSGVAGQGLGTFH